MSEQVLNPYAAPSHDRLEVTSEFRWTPNDSANPIVLVRIGTFVPMEG